MQVYSGIDSLRFLRKSFTSLWLSSCVRHSTGALRNTGERTHALCVNSKIPLQYRVFISSMSEWNMEPIWSNPYTWLQEWISYGWEVKVSTLVGMEIRKSNQASHSSRLVVATRNRPPLINLIVKFNGRVRISVNCFHLGLCRYSSGLSWSQRYLK